MEIHLTPEFLRLEALRVTFSLKKQMLVKKIFLHMLMKHVCPESQVCIVFCLVSGCVRYKPSLTQIYKQVISHLDCASHVALKSFDGSIIKGTFF